MKNWLLCSTLVLCISCGTLPLKHNKHIAKTTIELGVIGLKKAKLHKTAFQTTAIPIFTNKVRVSAQVVPFTKQYLKKYNKALPYLGKKNVLNATTKTTPLFVKLQIQDNVAIISAINSKTNNTVANYLQQTPTSKFVSSINTVVSKQHLTDIKNADAYYLQTSKLKKQLLHLYKNGKVLKVIDLSSSTVFEYGLSSFCWGETPNRKIELKNLLEGTQKCTESTDVDAQKLKEKRMNSFKS